MLSGSVAMGAYALPRATRDFDFIVEIKKEDAEVFIQFFNSGFYCDKDAIVDAVKYKSMFNIIDHASGFKADFIVLKKGIFQKTEFERRTETELFGMKVFVISLEGLILSKLIWIQEFQSNIQIEDIKNLLANKNVDFAYVHYWIEQLKLNTFNLI